jgi:predicted CXXCH cytochrome family protein
MISCLTCHTIAEQISDNVIGRTFNKNFLRQPPPGVDSICFICHDRERLEQPNLHKLMLKDGKIYEPACLQCHEKVPDAAAGKSHAPLKQDSDLLCIGCHGKQVRAHPARADHILKMPPDMRQRLPAAKGPAPPLQLGDYDMIHCVTCHNPHEKGVIASGAGALGAGEKSLLRLPGRYELCVYCHTGLQIDREKLRRQPARNILKTPAQALTPHKPWSENKCKACHAITVKKREKPQAIFLCFRQGCHDTKLVDNEVRHDLSVLKNCYFCHESHGSEYAKLLRSNEERICHTCHPLLKEKNVAFPQLSDPLSVHQQFFDYQMNLGVETDNTCNFCHSSKHWAAIDRIDTGACADCHLNTRNILVKAAGSALNKHNTYSEKLCSACHDPHAAPYDGLLKKPRESYQN